MKRYVLTKGILGLAYAVTLLGFSSAWARPSLDKDPIEYQCTTEYAPVSCRTPAGKIAIYRNGCFARLARALECQPLDLDAFNQDILDGVKPKPIPDTGDVLCLLHCPHGYDQTKPCACKELPVEPFSLP